MLRCLGGIVVEVAVGCWPPPAVGLLVVAEGDAVAEGGVGSALVTFGLETGEAVGVPPFNRPIGGVFGTEPAIGGLGFAPPPVLLVLLV